MARKIDIVDDGVERAVQHAAPRAANSRHHRLRPVAHDRFGGLARRDRQGRHIALDVAAGVIDFDDGQEAGLVAVTQHAPVDESGLVDVATSEEPGLPFQVRPEIVPLDELTRRTGERA